MTFRPSKLDSTAVSIFEDILVELTNTVFVNSTNITTNIETAALSTTNQTFLKAFYFGNLTSMINLALLRV